MKAKCLYTAAAAALLLLLLLLLPVSITEATPLFIHAIPHPFGLTLAEFRVLV